MPVNERNQIQNILVSERLTVQMRRTISQWEQTLHGIKDRSKLNSLSKVKKFGEFLRIRGKERFEDAEKEDIDSYLATKNKSYNNNLIIVRRFCNDNSMNDIVKHLKPRPESLRPVPPSELLSPDEVVGLASATGDLEYKALVLTLFECSARVNEVLSLKLGDVLFSGVRDKDENHTLVATLHFGNSKGDVEKEPVTISMFATELKQWVESHPSKRNKQSWLFPSKRHPKKSVAYMTIWYLLRKAKERTGIQKRVNPHWFRHSSLSFCANELNYNEQLLKWRAGWRNTGMAARYIHSGGDLERKAYLRRQGYEIEEEKKEIPKAKPCPHCNHLNPYSNNACDLCGMPLDLKEYRNVLESRKHPRDVQKIEKLSEDVERLQKVLLAVIRQVQPDVDINKLLEDKSKQEALEEMGATKRPKSNLKLPEG